MGDVIIMALGCVLCAFIGFIYGVDKGFSTIRSTQTIVESVDIKKAITNTGLVVENKGFNVGDTLVIIKKIKDYE